MARIVCKFCGFEGDFTAFCMSDPMQSIKEWRHSGELPAAEWRCSRCGLHVRQRVTKKWDGSQAKEVVVLQAGVIAKEAA